MSIKSGFAKLMEMTSIPNLLATLAATGIFICCMYGICHPLWTEEVDTKKISKEVFIPPVPVKFVERTYVKSVLTQETLDENLFWVLASGKEVEVEVIHDKPSIPTVSFYVVYGDGEIAVKYISKFMASPEIYKEPFFYYWPVECRVESSRIVWGYQWQDKLVTGIPIAILVSAVMTFISWLLMWVIFHVIFYIGRMALKLFRPQKHLPDA